MTMFYIYETIIFGSEIFQNWALGNRKFYVTISV